MSYFVAFEEGYSGEADLGAFGGPLRMLGGKLHILRTVSSVMTTVARVVRIDFAYTSNEGPPHYSHVAVISHHVLISIGTT